MRRLSRKGENQERGSAAVQFALIAPTMLTLMMGLGELAFQGYAQSVLTGAVQKAARDSTIQGNANQTDSIDAAVQAAVKQAVPGAIFSSSRKNYDNYADISGEPFIDSKYPNNNSGVFDGVCDHGESYIDVNGNSKYDLDLSSSGQGGANDVTQYTMTMTYPRLFPIALLKWTKYVTLSATTILKNQPYATQSVNSGTKAGTCS